MDLKKWEVRIIAVAVVTPMIVFGALGAWGTYTNIVAVFHRSATALGVIAAGEGATLTLALTMVGLTMLGQPSPIVVRVGLWVLPASASAVGVVTARSLVESIVFAVTPMAMCVSAEGIGLLARRVVVYQTGVDIEIQRKNAETLQKISYHRGLARNHPNEKARQRSDRKAWKLAKRAGVGDFVLGASLVDVQRSRMTSGADAALSEMFGLPEQTADSGQTADRQRTAGQPDSRTADRQPDSGQTAGQTAGPDDRTDSEGEETDSRVGQPAPRERHTTKMSVRAYILSLLDETPDLSKSDAWDFVLGRFGPDTKVDTFNKSWMRANNDKKAEK